MNMYVCMYIYVNMGVIMWLYVTMCVRVMNVILNLGCCMFKMCNRMCQTCCMIVTYCNVTKRRLELLVHQKPLHSAIEILQAAVNLGPHQNH